MSELHAEAKPRKFSTNTLNEQGDVSAVSPAHLVLALQAP